MVGASKIIAQQQPVRIADEITIARKNNSSRSYMGGGWGVGTFPASRGNGSALR